MDAKARLNQVAQIVQAAEKALKELNLFPRMTASTLSTRSSSP
jgi:hypothetical protein